MLSDTISTTELWVTAALTALALSADSLCASATDAVEFGKQKHKYLLIVLIAFVFALFHFFMPTIGFSIGKPFIDAIEDYVHYISFGILLFLGLRGLIGRIFELHVSRMNALAEKAEFEILPYIEKLKAEGLNMRRIKKELKELGKELQRHDEQAIQEIELKDPTKYKELGIFLQHCSKWLSERKYKELAHPKTEEEKAKKRLLKIFVTVIVQAFATSLDALMIGFSYVGTVSNYAQALPIFALFFGIVFVMCLIGGALGKFVGEKSETWADIIGSLVLIGIGIKALF